MKVCNVCNITKDFNLFAKNGNYSDGHKRTCKQCCNEHNKLYYKTNKDKITRQHHEYYTKNKEKTHARTKRYRLHNNERTKEIHRTRMIYDVQYILKKLLRSRLNRVMKGVSKADTTLALLGITLDEFKIHLESQFKAGMTWENQGKWHIDHIKPCAAFDLTDIPQQKQCFHYTNLQPLWAVDNLKKGSKFPLASELTT
jgi:hypothetical protein